MRALSIAATGMSAQQMRVEVISNNLANMSTTGYNARRAEFADLHYEQAARPGTISSATGTELPTGVQLGLGVRPSSVTVELQQGSLVQTGGDLDVAIEGNGYIEVELPSGQSGFTRDGALKRTGDGQIVTSDGYPAVPGITIPEDARSVSINADGEVYGYFMEEPEPQLLGQLDSGDLLQRQGAGGDRLERLPRDGGLGAGDRRRSGNRRAGHVPPGLPGGQRRRSGAGDHPPDRGAARLRAELQGDLGGRPDARRDDADPMIRAAFLLFLGVAPAAADVVVATRTVRAQSLIGPGDVALSEGDVAGMADSLDAVVGREARVTLYAGRPVRSGDVGAPALIDRNQIVTLSFRQGGLAISADGRALDRAGAGERVRVMNLASRSIVVGEVAENGTILVSGTYR